MYFRSSWNYLNFLCRISQDDYDDGDGWKADHFYSEEDRSTIAEEVNKVSFYAKKQSSSANLTEKACQRCQLVSRQAA